MPIAAAGEFLICRRVYEGEKAVDLGGRSVIVQSQSPKDKFRIELTLRLLQPRPAGFDLKTFDPTDWRKVATTVHMERLDDREDLSILGVVAYVVREPRPFIQIMGQLDPLNDKLERSQN